MSRTCQENGRDHKLYIYMYVLILARRQPHLHVSAAYTVQSTGKGMVLKDAETN